MHPPTLKEACNLGANDIHEKPVSFDGAIQLATTIYDYWRSVRQPGVKPE
jgi:hypothetical protein